jgi:hypothetical protein
MNNERARQSSFAIIDDEADLVDCEDNTETKLEE